MQAAVEVAVVRPVAVELMVMAASVVAAAVMAAAVVAAALVEVVEEAVVDLRGTAYRNCQRGTDSSMRSRAKSKQAGNTRIEE